MRFIFRLLIRIVSIVLMLIGLGFVVDLFLGKGKTTLTKKTTMRENRYGH